MDFELEILKKVEELVLAGEWCKATLLLLEERGKLLSELSSYKERAEKEKERKRRYRKAETDGDGQRRTETDRDGWRRTETDRDGQRKEKEKEKRSKKEKEKEKEIRDINISDCSDNLTNSNSATYDETKLCFVVGDKLLEKYYNLYGRDFTEREIKKAAMWVASVPKTRWKKDWRKFLYNWLSKAYDIELSKRIRAQNSSSSQLPNNVLQLNSADTFARALAKLYNYETWDSIEPRVRANVFEWQQYHKFRESFTTVLSLVKKYYVRAISEREEKIYRAITGQEKQNDL